MNQKIISVVGLGYVGLPVAISMAKKFKVIGFDIKKSRLDELKKGIDVTNEVNIADLKNPNLSFTENPEDLRNANFHIVTVPTPIDDAHKPDLKALMSASIALGKILKKNDCVVYESTVYPGLTEEVCVPLLEKHSGLVYKKDFKVGYSPERINPGDPARRFETIKKVVSGCDEEALQLVSDVYGSVVTAGIHKAQSIAVAEAAKVIENTQRDLNIALINELALIFNKMKIDTTEVLEAAGTKWNFLPFRPGLVGGHCIGVDPYYLTYQSEKYGYIPQVILSGRRINDSMGSFIAQETIKLMSQNGLTIKKSRIALCGITFKENCPDTRNSKVIDIIQSLKEYSANVVICDPWAIEEEVKEEYQLELTNWEHVSECDVIIFAVAHEQFKNIDNAKLLKKIKPGGIVVDVKNIFRERNLQEQGLIHWKL